MNPLPLPDETVDRLDSYHARRWETLLSVDDMVAATINKLEDIGELNNTFIIFTSDHGYHLGTVFQLSPICFSLLVSEIFVHSTWTLIIIFILVKLSRLHIKEIQYTN